MRDRVKASLCAGAYVGLVYLIGSYLGYRAGKAQGEYEMFMRQVNEVVDKANAALKEEHPKYFESEES